MHLNRSYPQSFGGFADRKTGLGSVRAYQPKKRTQQASDPREDRSISEVEATGQHRKADAEDRKKTAVLRRRMLK